MKKMQIYQARREILSITEWSDGAQRAALIILEGFDWNTREKRFNTKKHWINYLSTTSETYDIDQDVLLLGLTELLETGLVEVKGNFAHGQTVLSTMEIPE